MGQREPSPGTIANREFVRRAKAQTQVFCNKCGHVGPRGEHDDSPCPYEAVPVR